MYSQDKKVKCAGSLVGGFFGGGKPAGLPLDIARVMGRVEELATHAEKHAAGRDLVLVVGNTGAGKSTFVNFMAGCGMRELTDEEYGDEMDFLVTTDAPIMEIGHGRPSYTSEPQVYYDRETELTYCDCPGFFDNRGAEFDITNAYAITSMLKRAKSIKAVVVLVNAHSLKSDRAKGVRDTCNIIMRLLGVQETSIADYKDSMMIVISRNDCEYTMVQHRENLSDFDSPIIQSMLDRVYQFDPLDRSEYIEAGRAKSREELIVFLRHSPGIVDPSGQNFGFALGTDSLHRLHEIIDCVATQIRKAFHDKNYSEVNKLILSLTRLKELGSREVFEALEQVGSMMREQIRTLEGNDDNLPFLEQIRDEIAYVTKERSGPDPG